MTDPLHLRSLSTPTHLSTGLPSTLNSCNLLREQDLLGKLKEGMDPAFRLFITALPNDEFPLGLLQMCTKVCARSILEAHHSTVCSTVIRLLAFVSFGQRSWPFKSSILCQGILYSPVPGRNKTVVNRIIAWPPRQHYPTTEGDLEYF